MGKAGGGLALLLLLLSGSARAGKLLGPPPAGEESTAGIEQCDQDGVVTCKRVTVNFEVIGDAEIEFPEGVVMSRHQNLTFGYEYEGDHGSFEKSEAILTYSDGGFYAEINLARPDKLYVVENCGGDRFVLLEMDEVHNRGDAEGQAVDTPPTAGLRDSYVVGSSLDAYAAEDEAESRSGPTLVHVMFYITEEFLNKTTDYMTYVKGLVNHANAGYKNSNINMELRIFCVELLPPSLLKEDNDTIAMLTQFRTVKGNHTATLNSADIALLVISQPRSRLCGQAYVNAYQNNWLFGWVGKNCQITVTGHEVGHMFGCCHNKEVGDTCTTTENFEIGYLVPGAGVRTIMAYYNVSNPTQLNYFSSPTYQLNNVTAGIVNQVDCRRAHVERALTMAGKGNQLGQCSNHTATTTTTTTQMPTTTTTLPSTPPPTTTTTTRPPTTPSNTPPPSTMRPPTTTMRPTQPPTNKPRPPHGRRHKYDIKIDVEW